MLSPNPSDFQPNVRLGPLAQALDPSGGFCSRCGTPWSFVRHHSTQYTDSRGCFALCEFCWRECPREERVSYYRELFDLWVAQGAEIATPECWSLIEAAVLGGK